MSGKTEFGVLGIGNAIVDAVNGVFNGLGRSAARFALSAQKLMANPPAAVSGDDRRTYDADEDRPTIGVTALIALVLAGVIAFWVAA